MRGSDSGIAETKLNATGGKRERFDEKLIAGYDKKNRAKRRVFVSLTEDSDHRKRQGE